MYSGDDKKPTIPDEALKYGPAQPNTYRRADGTWQPLQQSNGPVQPRLPGDSSIYTPEIISRLSPVERASMLAEMQSSDGWQVLIYLLEQKKAEIAQVLTAELKYSETQKFRGQHSMLNWVVAIPDIAVNDATYREGQQSNLPDSGFVEYKGKSIPRNL